MEGGPAELTTAVATDPAMQGQPGETAKVTTDPAMEGGSAKVTPKLLNKKILQ